MADLTREDLALSGLLTMTPGGVIAAGVIMPAAGCAAVFLRFYARQWQRLGLAADDWTMLAGAILVAVLGVILIVGASIGALGLHSLPANPTDDPNDDTIAQGAPDRKAEATLRTYNIVEKIAFALIKTSIVLMYRRIFLGGIWRAVSAAAIAFLAAATAAFVVTSAMQCHSRNWELRYAGWALEHHCVSAELSTLIFANVDVATDLAILLMPLPVVYSLKMNVRRKATAFAIFILASSSVAVSIIRLAILAALAHRDKVAGTGYRDLLGVMSTVPTMSIIEAGIAIVAACTPTFRHLVTVKLLGMSSEDTPSKASEYVPNGSGKRVYAFSGNNQKSRTLNEDLEFDELISNRSVSEGNVTKKEPVARAVCTE